MHKIYFDYAATTPADPQVIKAMEPYFFERFGNASSPHSLGQEAMAALENAREILACFIGAKPQEIIFNSGATEANNHAVFGVAHAQKHKGDHIIVSTVEHHSVLEPAKALEAQGFRISYLMVDEFGLINPQDVKEAITDKTILIATIHASNEIGTIQPIADIGKIAKAHQIPFLVDSVQAIGHIPVNVDELHADLLSISAHKFYGPKGIGALYVRDGIRISPYLWGGDQEKGRRASTQNVAGAVGLAKAVELCQANMERESKQQIKWRDRLLQEVPRRVEGVKINGHPTKRLPNNAHFSFEQAQGESLLMSLDMVNIAASMGSACTSGAMEPSHVLRAIGLSDEMAYGALRISLGRWNKEADIEHFLEQLPQLVQSLRV
ncbi:MAG TPA: cysteine desulfurase family protein [Candidatus Omnitrophota bacterium]|nr:cysteine desulfurase family protein [Candidatus Omnitrophota bacterium]